MIFVAAHGRSANSLEEQAAIHSRMSYPLLQEVNGATLRDAWGFKDRHDIFVFARDGKLLEQIHDTKSAGSAAGYATLKTQLLAHLKDTP